MHHTAVNLQKRLRHPRIAGFLYSSYTIPLYPFCCHCGRSLYLHGIRFLQLCPVIMRSLNKAVDCRHNIAYCFTVNFFL